MEISLEFFAVESKASEAKQVPKKGDGLLLVIQLGTEASLVTPSPTTTGSSIAWWWLSG